MPLLLALLALIYAAPVYAGAIRAVTTERGLLVESYPGEFDRGPTRETVDDPAVFWFRNLATGVFNSTSITDSLYAYTGSGQNDPREAAQYLIDSDGSVNFALTGRSWEVASQPAGPYWAAINTEDDYFNTLYFMHEDSPDPVWEYHLGYGYVGGTRGFQFSNDGSTLALFFGQLNQQPPYIFAWDVATLDSLPWCAYVADSGQGISARAMAVSFDGALIAGTADNYIHVVWRDSSTTRDIVQIDASTDGLAMSADGNWLLTGFQSVRCRRWDGQHYVQWWSSGVNMRFCGQLLISPDTTYAVSCWYAQTYDRNYIRVHDLQTGLPIWSYTYRQGTDYQDLPVDADISADGNWFAVGSWGDAGEQNGEAVVFSRWYPEPYYELDLPGSCFSLDLSSNGEYLLAAGKHVHANVFGNGGDAYEVWLDPPRHSLLSIVDTAFVRTDSACFCADTVAITPRIANLGYAPFSIAELFLATVLEDSSYWRVDESQLGTVVNPGDTVQLRAWYAPCSVFSGFPVLHFSVSTGDERQDGMIPCEIPSRLCTGTESDFIPHPSSFVLSAYPNPFNPTTTLEYTLPSAGRLELKVFDLAGRIVESLTAERVNAGTHRISLNLEGQASGVYFARLTSSPGVRTQKLMLLK